MEDRKDEADQDIKGTESKAKPLNPSHYRLAEAGLWWDSFEEDPVFDITQEFDDQLTLNEGIHPEIVKCYLVSAFRNFILF